MQYNVTADTRSLYIHWPFCPYRCHFCPFVTISGQSHLMDRYHAALMNELKVFVHEQRHKLSLETIYIGGGTPSTWPEKLLLDMSGILRESFDLSALSEMTIEINPGTVTKEKLLLFKEIGINRISVGIQSLDDAVLAGLNRHQKVSDVYNVVEWADGLFDHFSVDLIVGLPGISTENWKDTIAKIVNWPINHVSVYFLSIHENTPLYKRLERNELALPADDPIVDLYYWTRNEFEKHGLLQYELSSFARVGHESLHNQVYWDHKPYKGIGIGACSFDGTSRFQNTKNVMKYINGQEKNENPIETCEIITNEQRILEEVMLGLRRRKGLFYPAVLEKMESGQQEKFLHKMEYFEKNGFIKKIENRIYLEHHVLAVENEIAVKLLE